MARVSAPPKTRSERRIASIHAEGQRLAQGRLGIGRAHGDGGDAAAEAVLQAQAFFQGMGVVGIDDERDPFADQGVGDRVDLHLGGVRDLFDAGDDEHGMILVWVNAVSSRRVVMPEFCALEKNRK